ncbi:MAG: DUF932 domain-containing protein [Exiguobacterium sp.]|nr:DUF932 domain-containing protein [Exiguobacterium sp.]
MLIMEEGKYVSRDEVARIDTPSSTDTWHPVPHIDVIEAVTEVVKAHRWDIEDERFGLASEGKKMFGVMEISRSSSPQWHRCIGIRNSHDKSLAVSLSAGIAVLVCSNLAFGGTRLINRKHTSRIDLNELIARAVALLEDDFLTTETRCEDLKDEYLKNDDEARSCIVRAAELGVINSSDILPVYREFKEPSYVEFRESSRWSLLNAMTEIVKKYTPQRVDHSYLALNRAFGLDGRPAAIFT